MPRVSRSSAPPGQAHGPSNGNLVSQRLRDGTVVTRTYDALNRMVSRTAGAADLELYYAYDTVGRLVAASDTANVFWAAGYDALGRKVSETSFGRTVTSAYDAGGRRTRFTWHDGFYVDYTYSATGEMLEVRENGARSGVGVLARYAYDDLGRRVSLTRGNGLVTSYAYDAASRLSETTQAGAGIATVSGFLYDPASQIVRRDRSNAAYDWTGHANVDRPYGVNGLNQLTSSGSNVLSYDGRGNLASDGVRTFGYDSRDQLGNYRGGGQPDYLYHDMLGRLRQLSAEGVTLDYDGSQMVAEYDYSGPLLRRYVHGAGVDEPLVWYEGAGVADRRFLHADERGSIVAITDSAGRKLAILTYDEYGIPGPGNVLANGRAPRFQYTGQMWIASLGMYDYKARVYSPTLGRFLQADPIGYGDGMNLYGYVGGDPVNFVDPTGTLNCQREGGYASYTPEGGIVVNVGRTVCQLEDWDYNLPPSVNTSPFMGPVTKEHPAPTPEPCNPGAADSFFENGLDAVGLIGDGLAVAGALTGNPVLLGVGEGLNVISTLGSAALDISQGDTVGLAFDGASFAAGLVPGARLARRFGGAGLDLGRRANGQFMRNWRGIQKAQDIGTKGLQSQATAKTLDAARCSR